MATLDVLSSSLKTCKSLQKAVFEIVHGISIISESFCFALVQFIHSFTFTIKSRSMPLSSVTLPFSSGLQLSVPAKPNYR